MGAGQVWGAGTAAAGSDFLFSRLGGGGFFFSAWEPGPGCAVSPSEEESLLLDAFFLFFFFFFFAAA